MKLSDFSTDLRLELLAVLREREAFWPSSFRASAFAAFRFMGRELRFDTRQYDFAILLKEEFYRLYGVEIELREGKYQTGLRLDDREEVRRIRDDIFSCTEEIGEWDWGEDGESQQLISAILAQLFLSCGAFRSPRVSYQLEFAMQRPQACELFQAFFSRLDMEFHSIRHHGYHVLYAKEGQTIADFLRYSSAHRCLLSFEELRVEKEVLNRVNRVVNCDNANAQRLADASYKQRKRILYLQEEGILQTLSPELREAAEMRLRYPELSLSELGQMLETPLGKSGMNHRLKRLERIAEEQEDRTVVK